MIKCEEGSCPGHLGKFSNCVDEALWVMSMEGAGQATGHTEAHGHHTAIVLTDREAVEVEPGRVVTVAAGFYLVSEDDRGFVWATSFGSEVDLDVAFAVQDRRYGEWPEINEPG